jgi:predicted  nucleic acid-binding Zn-ribbon protein
MSPTTGGLKDLHLLHERLHKKQSELESGPRKIALRVGICKKKLVEIAEQKNCITNLQKAADDKNLQFRTNEQKINDLKGKLNTAASNREFDIFKGQIEADTAANAVLEDEYLELLEQVDGAREQYKVLEGELEEATRLAKEIASAVKAAEAGVQVAIDELTKEVKVAEICIPSKFGDDYRRLVQAYGPGAIAVAEEGACTECFTELSPQYQLELRVGKVIRCRMCGRLLYNEDAEG